MCNKVHKNRLDSDRPPHGRRLHVLTERSIYNLYNSALFGLCSLRHSGVVRFA